MRDVLLYFAWIHNGNWDEIYKSLDQKEKIDFSKLELIKNKMNSKYITILDAEYPNKLKQIYKPPFVIFYHGNIELISKRNVAIVGTRKPTTYGEKWAAKFTKEIVDNKYQIVSGMALGIDAIAHNTCLKHKGASIAVLGSGINKIYPLKNKYIYEKLFNDHLILSELPNDTEPTKDSFKARNRLISGISSGVLVIEAANKSGTMNTVAHAINQNREVFCVPNALDGLTGTNLLIKQGAKLVENINDIINEL